MNGAAPPRIPPLFRPGLLTLRGLFFRVLFGHMPAHQTAADCADHRMMSGIMPRDSAHDGSLHAAGCVRRADC